MISAGRQALELFATRLSGGRQHYASLLKYSRRIFPVKYDEDLKEKVKEVPDEFRHVYRDFLPDPNYEFKNLLREKLEREDMIARRYVLDIPEFYVGSILSVTISDPNASGKTNKFTGICISRAGAGLRSTVTLRNIVDGLGVEIMYYLYSPLVLSIETLRLEKRLDDHLHYYRDCLPEYSTISMDMEAEPLPDGIPAPVNDIKVEFKPLPWHRKWWRHDLKGVNYPKLSMWHVVDKKKHSEPIWEKLDLMKEYRSTITEEEQARIYRDLIPHLPKFEEARRKVKKIRAFKSVDIKTNN